MDPLLKTTTVLLTVNSIVGKETYSVLGARAQIIALMDSLWFCVAPSTHLSSSLRSQRSLKMGLTYPARFLGCDLLLLEDHPDETHNIVGMGMCYPYRPDNKCVEVSRQWRQSGNTLPNTPSSCPPGHRYERELRSRSSPVDTKHA